MSMFEQTAKVRAAQLRLSAARRELSTPVASLLARGHAHPLATVGVAAGAGFVLGSFNVHPLRLPGLGSLLGGGLAEVVAHGTRLVAELGKAGQAAGNPDDGDAAEASDGEPS